MATIRAVIVTADLDRLAGFYLEALAATETTRYPPDGDVFYLGLALGDSEFGLVANPAAADTPRGGMLLSIEVDDVDATLDLVNDGGGLVKGPPTDMPWGQRVAHVEDPDGNAINLTQDI